MAARYKMAGKLAQLVDVSGSFRVYDMMKLMKWFIAKGKFHLYPRITCGIKPENRTTDRRNSGEGFR